MSNANGLSDAQAERLDVLAEELAEAIVEISKVKRHGYQSSNPLSAGSATNKQNLEIELGNVVRAVNRLVEAGDLANWAITQAADAKYAEGNRWMHFQ